MFRINIYLNVKDYFKAIFLNYEKNHIKKKCANVLKKQSGKKYFEFTSQCRVAFLYILKYFKEIDPSRNEIIFSAYNLPEMINVAKNLGFKIEFCDIKRDSGTMDEKILIKKINKRTKAIILTNMFNDFKHSKKIKQIAIKHNIKLIEDNAIYFDNYSLVENKKFNSGYLGDYTIYSFNIMKNISALYGGAVTTNDKKFITFLNSENEINKKFFLSKILHQSVIYFILKIMSVKIFYKTIFIYIIKKAHKNKFKPLLKLFYPSIKFKTINFPNYYFTKISNFSLKLAYLQLKNKKKRKENFLKRKKKNFYYKKQLSSIDNKKINLIKILDQNYQNFLDFPILVDNKSKMNNFFLEKNIETKYINYRNCEKIFKKNKRMKCKNSEYYEKHLLGLPSHEKITFNYIENIVRTIKSYLKSEN